MSGTIYNALYYERVSTIHDSQTNSLENQRRLCESYLKRHPDIHLAEPIDTYSERISGKTDLRPKFEAMLKRISLGDINYLMVKDLKRLSRSTEVSAQLRNLAKKYRFKLILLSTGQVYDPNADENRLLYGFESLTNEELVYRQSEYGRIAHHQKMEAKRLNRQNVTFGYRWNYDKNDMEIYEPEAALVRKLFDLYVFNSRGVQELSSFLYSHGIYKSTVTIRKWLAETAYTGVFHMNKKGSELGVGSGQKTRRYDNPKSEWVPVERPDLRIVEQEVFDLAQKIMHARKNFYDTDKNGVAQGRFTGSHLFSSKIFCAECGSSYLFDYVSQRNRTPIYYDAFRRKKKSITDSCPNIAYKRLYEDDLKSIVLEAINLTIQEGENCFKLLTKALEDILKSERHSDKIISNLKREISSSQRKADQIKSAFIYAEGELRDDLMRDYSQIKEKIASLNTELAQVIDTKENEDNISYQMNQIRNTLKELHQVPELDRQIIDIFINKILVHKDGTIEILMNTDNILTYHFSSPYKKRIPKKESSFYPTKCTPIYDFNLYRYTGTKVIQADRYCNCLKAPTPPSL